MKAVSEKERELAEMKKRVELLEAEIQEEKEKRMSPEGEALAKAFAEPIAKMFAAAIAATVVAPIIVASEEKE